MKTTQTQSYYYGIFTSLTLIATSFGLTPSAEANQYRAKPTIIKSEKLPLRRNLYTCQPERMEDRCQDKKCITQFRVIEKKGTEIIITTGFREQWGWRKTDIRHTTHVDRKLVIESNPQMRGIYVRAEKDEDLATSASAEIYHDREYGIIGTLKNSLMSEPIDVTCKESTPQAK